MANLIVAVVVMVIGDVISEKFHKFITYKTFQLHKYLLHSCNGFILTGLWINKLQIIILSTNTLLQVWLLL